VRDLIAGVNRPGFPGDSALPMATMTWLGLIVSLGLSVSVIPWAAAEAVYSSRSAWVNLSQSPG
jgi:hypothetical protein